MILITLSWDQTLACRAEYHALKSLIAANENKLASFIHFVRKYFLSLCRVLGQALRITQWTDRLCSLRQELTSSSAKSLTCQVLPSLSFHWSCIIKPKMNNSLRKAPPVEERMCMLESRSSPWLAREEGALWSFLYNMFSCSGITRYKVVKRHVGGHSDNLLQNWD